MTFADIKGNDALKKALSGMVDSGKIPHAIMFHEDDGGQGIALALAYLQYLYCQNRSSGDACSECPECNKVSKLIHPDLHFIFPTTSAHESVEFLQQWRDLVSEGPFTENSFRESLPLTEKSLLIAVREANSLLKTLSLSALEGGYRSVLVYLPELMNQEAANKLLKMVEEPPEFTQFVFVTHAPEKVMPTIVSRCQRFRVTSERVADDFEADEVLSPLFSSLMNALLSHDLFSTLTAASAISSLPNRESVKAFCKFASVRLRQMFLIQQGLPVSSDVSDDVRAWAGRCKKTFPRRATEAISRTSMLVGRNCNLKIIFTDLADKLFYMI